MRSCSSYLWFRAIINLTFFHLVRAGAYWHKIHDIHVCAFAVHTKESVKTFNANAEKFYSWTVVYFTLADLRRKPIKFRDFDPFCFCLFGWKISKYFKAVVCFGKLKIRFRSFTQLQNAQKNNRHNLIMIDNTWKLLASIDSCPF